MRATGVSNFATRHLDEMREDAFEPPAVHQMELHPFWFPEELLYRCMADKTVVQAYGVLGGKAKKARSSNMFLLCVVFSCVAILRVEGCLNSTP